MELLQDSKIHFVIRRMRCSCSATPTMLQNLQSSHTIDEYYTSQITSISSVYFSAAEIQRDQFFQDFYLRVKDGTLQWPKYCKQPHEFSIYNDCIFCGTRIVLAIKIQSLVLWELYSTHTDIEKMKVLAHEYCWCPNIDRNISSYILQCSTVPLYAVILHRIVHISGRYLKTSGVDYILITPFPLWVSTL